MEMYVVRHVLDVSVFQSVLGMGPITSARHYGITVALWVLTITVALSTDDLGSILEIFGAFGANVSLCLACFHPRCVDYAIGYNRALPSMVTVLRQLFTGCMLWCCGKEGGDTGGTAALSS